MLIAIISDTHDNLFTLNKAIAFINERGCDVLLHAGDMSRTDTLEHIAQKFHGPIHIVEGNSDINPENFHALAKIYPLLTFHGPTASLELDGLRIGITHKPQDAKQLAASGSYDLIIHGHDHKPWQSFVGTAEILNPGNVQDTRYPATFALYDTTTRKAQLVQIGKL